MEAVFSICPLEACRYEFMQRALIAAVLVGITAPAIGVFLVQRRLSLMGDGIGHVAFTGVAAGLLTGTSPVLAALIVAVLGAVALELLRERGRTAGDVALALIFYGGLAGGVLLTGFSDTSSSSLVSYLFGSVLTVSTSDVVATAAVAAFVVGLTLLLRKQLFAVCYDDEVAKVAGLPVRALNLLIAVTAAVTIAVTMRVVGILLVASMLVLPVAAVQQVTRSFRATTVAGILAGAAIAIAGLLIAYYGDARPAATIVLTAIGSFALCAAWGRMRMGN